MRATTVAISMALAAAGTAPSAWAGTVWEARGKLGYEHRSAEKVRIQGWIDGDRARLEMEGFAPIDREDYLVTRDGGEQIFVVTPGEQRYMEFMGSGGLADLAELTGGLLQFELSDVSAEVVKRSSGGEILGHSTVRLDWKASYKVAMKTGFGQDQEMRYEAEGSSWLASDLKVDDFGLWLWNGDLQRVLDAAHGGEKGFPLRIQSRTRETQPDGRVDTSTSELEITRLRQEAILASRFEIPSHYQEFRLPGFGGANPLDALKDILEGQDGSR